MPLYFLFVFVLYEDTPVFRNYCQHNRAFGDQHHHGVGAFILLVFVHTRRGHSRVQTLVLQGMYLQLYTQQLVQHPLLMQSVSHQEWQIIFEEKNQSYNLPQTKAYSNPFKQRHIQIRLNEIQNLQIPIKDVCLHVNGRTRTLRQY